ncbi:porin, partial [Salmonella enterica subsp. enterica serovar Anatum]|nr:porin [Salmonella enterica subsp. enterica serovar Anatum]
LVKYIDVGSYYYFNKNMSAYVDYKINLLKDGNPSNPNTDNTVDSSRRRGRPPLLAGNYVDIKSLIRSMGIVLRSPTKAQIGVIYE